MRNNSKDDDDLSLLDNIDNISWWEWIIIWVLLNAFIVWCCFQCRPDSFICNFLSWVYDFMYDLAKWSGLT